MHHINKKGTKVKSTEQIAKPSPTPNTGRFATLRGLLQLNGSGAPRSDALTAGGGNRATPAHRHLATVSLLVLAAALGTLGLTSAPALAAPEAPAPVVVESVTATSATFQGELNPGKEGVAGTYGREGTYQFLYDDDGSCEGGGEAPTPPGPALGGGKEALPPQEVTGLAPGTEYTVCLLDRSNVAGSTVGSAVTFTTSVGAPEIDGESVSSVESSDATLEAEISPGGEEATYQFEYGTGEAYGTRTPKTAIAGTTGTTTVRVHIAGLDPNTAYHYRVTASNEISGKRETTDGHDKALATPIVLGSEPTGLCPNEKQREEQPYGLKLPDCRAYEMVSPLNSNGQDATEPEAEAVPRASVSGEAVVYASKGVFGDATGSTVENQYLSRRGPEGWSTQPITPLHDPQKLEIEASYALGVFTPELTGGVAGDNASLPGTPALGAGERLYVADFATNSYEYVGSSFVGPTSSYTALPLGASADLSRVVFGINGEKGILEWFDGRDIPVGVFNDGEVMQETTVGSPSRTIFLHWAHKVWHAVSSNASRIYFSSPSGLEEESVAGLRVASLYVRENAEQPQSPVEKPQSPEEECTVSTDACTIEVSASQRSVPDPNGPQTALYQGASADGSKVFFTSTSELTNDAYTGLDDNAANLYEYELSGSGKPGKLTDLTVDNAGDGAAVQGVVQISEDGSYVYFVADGKLAKGALAGAPNLYVSHDGGAPTFIATLDAADVEDWLGFEDEHSGGNTPTNAGAIYESGPAVNTAVVTPSGTRLAFKSYRELTGYDNRDANTAKPDDEIYLYDAETGGLVCASCNPTGARPIGSSSLKADVYPVYRPQVAYRPRNLIEGGTLFFDSFDALVPHASDGRENVYEYEEGHVHAISDVAGGFNSFLLDVGANGDNVFFASAAQLLPEDTSNNIVVYDARVGGGFPVKVPPPPCDNGDACKPPPTPQPPAFGAPASATFSGAGNVTPAIPAEPSVKPKGRVAKCKKGDVRKKGKCIRAHRSKKKAKKASREKRGN
jgi:hypothetical protein